MTLGRKLLDMRRISCRHSLLVFGRLDHPDEMEKTWIMSSIDFLLTASVMPGGGGGAGSMDTVG